MVIVSSRHAGQGEAIDHSLRRTFRSLLPRFADVRDDSVQRATELEAVNETGEVDAEAVVFR